MRDLLGACHFGKGRHIVRAKGGCLGWAKEDLISAGVQYFDQPTMVDGNIITANGPESAGQFAQLITDILLKQ